MRGLHWAILSLASIQVNAAESVAFSNTEYVTEAGDHFDGALSIPGNRPGAVSAEFDFLSDRVDQVTGAFAQPTFEVAWAIRLADGSHHTSLPDGSWFGRTAPRIVPEILAFDTTTGAGTALLTLPFATTDLREMYRYPGMPESTAAIEVALDWAGELAFDSQGAPLSPKWSGVMPFSVTHDDIFVLLAESSIRPTGETLGVVALRTPAAASRVFDLEVTDDVVATTSVSQVTIPAGHSSVGFNVVGGMPGSFRIRVLEANEEVAVTPRRLVRPGPDAVPLTIDTTGGPNGGPIARGGGGEDLYEWLAECVPPAVYGGGKANHKVCGGCTFGIPTVDCSMTMALVSPAYCDSAWQLECETGGIVTIPSEMYEYVGTTIIECITILVASAEAECCLYTKSTTMVAVTDMKDCL